MAVPKKKSSPSRRGNRRGGKLSRRTIHVALAYDSHGNPRVSHAAPLNGGEYKPGITFGKPAIDSDDE